MVIIGILRLSRWKDHVLFTVPVTLLGVNLALQTHPNTWSPGWRIGLVLAANILAVAFAFMVNDIEDAPDDAHDPSRAARNAITSGLLTPRGGWIVSVLVAVLALVLFARVNREVGLIGGLTLLLGFLYSWRKVRLKALPVVDVIAHLLMLSSLLFLAGYFAYDRNPGTVWWVAVGVGFISAYGQLYNQLRDYAMDQAAGLRNTAHVIGPRYTQWAMYGCLVAAIICLGITVLLGLWPVWLALIPLGLSPLLFLLQTNTDMRGTAAIDITGRAQVGALIVANIMMAIWIIVMGMR